MRSLNKCDLMKKNTGLSNRVNAFSIFLVLTIVSGVMIYLSYEGIICDGLVACMFLMGLFIIFTSVLAFVSLVLFLLRNVKIQS